LVAADPGNAQAQRDLSITHSNLGDLALWAGDGEGAERHYRAALTAIEPLADLDSQAAEFANLLRQRLAELDPAK
jgi:hypothetical protein